MSKIFLTAEEAFNTIKDGVSVVSSGGYTYSRDYYFAFGTYPSCLRSGEHTLEGMKRISNRWELLTDKDIVLDHGFAAHDYIHPIREDQTVWFKDLNKFLEDNLTVTEYKDPRSNKEMVLKYFEEI